MTDDTNSCGCPAPDPIPPSLPSIDNDEAWFWRRECERLHLELAEEREKNNDWTRDWGMVLSFCAPGIHGMDMRSTEQGVGRRQVGEYMDELRP
jgi:hypothetical protein